MLTLGLNFPADSFATCYGVSAGSITSSLGALSPYFCLGLLDVLISEQKLAVEVAEVDGVQVYDVYLAKAGEDEVLEEFTSDSASSDHQNACLNLISDCNMTFLRVVVVTSLMR